MPAYYARCSFEAHNPNTGLLIVNVLHAEVDTLTSPPNWTSIATDVDAWLGQVWLNLLGSEDIYDQVVVTDSDYPGSTLGQGVHVRGVPGARAPSDGKLSRAMCGVASWKTATAKRYARGHTFFPPIQSSADLSSTGQIAPAGTYATAMSAFATAYVAGHTAGSTSYTPIVFSRTRVKRGETPFVFPIITWGSDLQQKWLRSRTHAP